LTANINLKIASQRVRLAASLDAVVRAQLVNKKPQSDARQLASIPLRLPIRLSLRAAQDD
jgi:hypothetical protein